MAVLEPFSQIKKKIKQNLFSFRGLFYIYVSYFYIFFYRYLLHIVVYITVVWIDTIIYFSMKINLKTNKKMTQNMIVGVGSLFQQIQEITKKTNKQQHTHKSLKKMYSVNMSSV